MFKEVLKAHSLRWKTKHKLCFPPVPGVVNRDSFPGSNALFHASEEDAPICLAFRHSHRVSFYLSVGYSSTSLHPFAPQALPRFTATMGAVTPARQVLRALTCGNDTVNQYDDLKQIRKICEENILKGRIYAG